MRLLNIATVVTVLAIAVDGDGSGQFARVDRGVDESNRAVGHRGVDSVWMSPERPLVAEDRHVGGIKSS